MKQHYSVYEPTLRQLKQQYEVALREKMLNKLERDRAVTHMTSLQTALDQIETQTETSRKMTFCRSDSQSNEVKRREHVKRQSESEGKETESSKEKERQQLQQTGLGQQARETKTDVKVTVMQFYLCMHFASVCL